MVYISSQETYLRATEYRGSSYRQVRVRFTYPKGMKGWVDLAGWLYGISIWFNSRRQSPIQVV